MFTIQSKEWIDTANPYTGETWARIPCGTVEDSARAVAVAKRAMTVVPWSKMTATERLKITRCIGGRSERQKPGGD